MRDTNQSAVLDVTDTALGNITDSGSTAGATHVGPNTHLHEDAEERGELRDLANLSWPRAPLSLMAADLTDLDHGAEATILAMVELTLHLGRNSFVILHAEDLVAETTDTPWREQVYRLQTLILNACRTMNLRAARVSLEMLDRGSDLVVHLRPTR